MDKPMEVVPTAIPEIIDRKALTRVLQSTPIAADAMDILVLAMIRVEFLLEIFYEKIMFNRIALYIGVASSGRFKYITDFTVFNVF
jgi:hypothetical protein